MKMLAPMTFALFVTAAYCLGAQPGPGRAAAEMLVPRTFEHPATPAFELPEEVLAAAGRGGLDGAEALPVMLEEHGKPTDPPDGR